MRKAHLTTAVIALVAVAVAYRVQPLRQLMIGS